MVEVPCLHAGIKSGESINHNYESAIGRATLSEYTNINRIMESRCARACARTCKKWHNALEEAHKSFGFSDMKSLTIMVSRYREGCQTNYFVIMCVKLFYSCYVRSAIYSDTNSGPFECCRSGRSVLISRAALTFQLTMYRQIEIRNNHRANGE